MKTCLTVLILFLQTHEFNNTNLGWVLSDNKKEIYTWIEYISKDNKPRLHYIAITDHPERYNPDKMKKTGVCSVGNAVQNVLEFDVDSKETKQ